MEQIDIGKIVIRLRHMDPPLVRRAMEGLGREVLHTLAARDTNRSSGCLQVHKIDLGTLSTSGDTTAAGLRQQISRAVSSAIQSIRPGGKGE